MIRWRNARGTVSAAITRARHAEVARAVYVFAAMRLDDLIAALRRPDAWPDPRPEHVETLQTHISVLLFGNDRVLKIKKPIRTDFLDFSTLEQRQRYCAEEVRLNADLAPGVYRRVVAITRVPGGEPRIDGEGPTIEYAVEMTRLPSRDMLARRLAEGRVPDDLAPRLVVLLADFHDAAPRGPDVAEHGRAETLRERLAGNAAAASAGRTDPPASIVRTRFEQFLDELAPLLSARPAEGRIREGHGDLHAGNICLLDDRIVIYDRIEFEPAFRCIDVAAEIAFLAMDLDGHGAVRLADDVTAGYADRTDDPGLAPLQPLYRAHYALVRAKTEGMRAGEEEVDEAERHEAAEASEAYYRRAAGYLAGPCLVVMCGLPGTGKSTIARAVARPLSAAVVDSDAVRKSLFGLAATERVPESRRAEIYGREATDRTYAAMRKEAEHRLRLGRSVILDATHPTRDRRIEACRAAAALDRPSLVVQVSATREVVRERLVRRADDAMETSDADLSVHDRAADRFEPARRDEIERGRLVEIDAARDDGASAAARVLAAALDARITTPPGAS